MSITEAQLVADLAALTPLLRENAAKAERDRKPDDAVMQSIEATGAYRYFVPKKYGGYEFTPSGFMEIGMALGRGCLSAGWVTTFCMEHNWLLALYDEPAQEDLFGKHPYIIAPGALAPKGMAEAVDVGYRLSGQWQWGTGIMHANWVMVGGIMPNDGGPPALGMFLLPIEDVQVVDTWHVDGMAGTGSNDIAVDGAFVPGHRVVDISTLRDGRSPGTKLHDNPIYRMPMLPFLGLTAAAPAVGAMLEAVDLFKQRLGGRQVYGTMEKQSDKPLAQARLGRAAVEADQVRSQLLSLAAEVHAWGSNEEPCPDEERARLRLNIALLVHRARDIVTDVVDACGASAHFLDNPLQRIQRDINTVIGHTVFDLDTGTELYGRALLGLPLNAPA